MTTDDDSFMAVSRPGLVLKFLASEMQEDAELCLAAVSQDGFALQQPGVQQDSLLVI